MPTVLILNILFAELETATHLPFVPASKNRFVFVPSVYSMAMFVAWDDVVVLPYSISVYCVLGLNLSNSVTKGLNPDGSIVPAPILSTLSGFAVLMSCANLSPPQIFFALLVILILSIVEFLKI